MIKKIMIIASFLMGAMDNDNKIPIPQTSNMTEFYKQQIIEMNSQMKSLNNESEWRAFANKYAKDNPEIEKDMQGNFFKLQKFSLVSNLAGCIVNINPENEAVIRGEISRLQGIKNKVDEIEAVLVKYEHDIKQKFLKSISEK